MSLNLVITLPRFSLTTPSRELLRSLLPLAAPALIAAAEASGVGLPGRLLLHAALGAAQDNLNA
ncbi:hypothetical protein [Peterkaempfera bronchialis]|uniref:Uncharacterized protein n=1 Tax=Peterkaempfera bronchialis TaxID=2126346 RepID=A0A345T4H6_9ACTN|nr:hypothetical protein [Peterkaempfera bronchialis]AXI80881.1 hypothetical protein C7M71_029380 [Peterkaempfera bronchialis]